MTPWQKVIIVERPATDDPSLLEVVTVVDPGATNYRRYRLIEDDPTELSSSVGVTSSDERAVACPYCGWSSASVGDDEPVAWRMTDEETGMPVWAHQRQIADWWAESGIEVTPLYTLPVSSQDAGLRREELVDVAVAALVAARQGSVSERAGAVIDALRAAAGKAGSDDASA